MGPGLLPSNIHSPRICLDIWLKTMNGKLGKMNTRRAARHRQLAEALQKTAVSCPPAPTHTLLGGRTPPGAGTGSPRNPLGGPTPAELSWSQAPGH